MADNLITGKESHNKLKPNGLPFTFSIGSVIINQSFVTFTTNNNKPLIDLENNFFNLNKTV